MPEPSSHRGRDSLRRFRRSRLWRFQDLMPRSIQFPLQGPRDRIAQTRPSVIRDFWRSYTKMSASVSLESAIMYWIKDILPARLGPRRLGHPLRRPLILVGK